MDEFQQRLLAAVENPERNRLLAVINSAFFLWVMSALLLSIGGSYITNHKQCLDDAEKVIERRSHLSQELLFRDGALADRIAKAKTLEEANQAGNTLLLRPPPAADQTKPGSIFTDLSERNYTEVQTEFETLTDRIKYAELPDSSIKERRLKSMVTSLDAEKMAQEFQERPPDEGRMLKFIQMNIGLDVARRTFEKVLDAVAYDFRPNCSVINVAKLTFGYRPPIVFAEISPLYTMPIRRKAIEDTLQAVEQKEGFRFRI